MRRLKPTIHIDHLKKVLEGIPENEREELKHEKIEEDFGLLELAKNAGKMRKRTTTRILYIVHSILSAGFAIVMDSWVLIEHD